LASRLAGLSRGPGGLRLAVGASVSDGSTEVYECETRSPRQCA
jgi:hypothetical protein